MFGKYRFNVLNRDIPCSIMFFRDGDYTVAHLYDSGREFYDYDTVKVVTQALTYLPPNRTWKEKIVFKGEFELSDTILIPSYTIFDGSQAKFKLKNGVNKDAFRNSDRTNGNSNIELYIGELDGNKVNQTATSFGINFYKVTDSILVLSNIHHCYTDGVYLNNCSRNRILYGKIEYCHKGLNMENSTLNEIDKLILRYNDKDGLTMFKNCNYNQVNEIIAEYNGQNPDPDEGGGGIRLDADTYDNRNIGNGFGLIVTRNNAYEGLLLINSVDNHVDFVYSYNDNVVQNGNNAGIEIYNNSHRNVIDYAVVYENPNVNWSLLIDGCNDCIVKNFYCYNNKPIIVHNSLRSQVLTAVELSSRVKSQFEFIDDFEGSALKNIWMFSGTGSYALQTDVLHGILRLTTGATTNNSVKINWNGNRVLQQNNRPKITVRFKLVNTTNIHFSIALYKDTDNYIIFRLDTVVRENGWIECMSGGVKTEAFPYIPLDNNYHEIAIYVETDRVNFLYDGSLVGTITSNIPTSFLEPQIMVATREDASKSVDIDYVVIRQDR